MTGSRHSARSSRTGPHQRGAAASLSSQSGAQSFLYSSVKDLLASKIETQELPSGSVLKEASIAIQLGVSRAPVRRALAMLHADGFIRAAEGQGYVVGEAHPVALSSRRLQEILVAQSDDIGRSATWERIFRRGQHHRHGRDAVRHLQDPGGRARQSSSRQPHRGRGEVLWRLMDRRLIEKNRKSHWIIGQMTARDIRETLEMRQVLEPRALAQVAAGLEPCLACNPHRTDRQGDR